jgi:N-acetylmuramoyl-L-alanine amidase
MQKRIIVFAALLFCMGQVLAQDLGSSLEFRHAGRVVNVPRIGERLEILPVLALVGAEASYSRAAETYGVSLGDHAVQFAVGRKYVLVNGSLMEGPDSPVPSPGGVAATREFLERALLGPLGFHLEAIPGGYRVMPGARFAEALRVRPAAADFGATTTLVLTLDRETSAEVTTDPEAGLVVHFPDATPQLDALVQFRSKRVIDLSCRGQDLFVSVQPGVGVINWHSLDRPSRVILELGRVQPTPTPVPENRRFVRQTGPPPIVIDPGHGGSDKGAVSSDGYSEKLLTLDIARRLARELAGRGHAVRLTRDGDEARALSDRTALANRLEAKVFISLHANASTVSSVRGAETYYMSLDDTSTDAHAAATAEMENRAGGGDRPRSPIDLILWDLAQAEVLNESAKLALAVQGRLNDRLGLNDRGVKQAPFVVLTGATMPAILVEVGFLTNRNEAQQLATTEHRQRLAEALAVGIDDFVRSR